MSFSGMNWNRPYLVQTFANGNFSLVMTLSWEFFLFEIPLPQVHELKKMIEKFDFLYISY